MYVRKRKVTTKPRKRVVRRPRRRVPRALGQTKVYTYNFSPTTQYLSVKSPGADFNVVPSGAVGFPLDRTVNFTTTPVSSASGIAGTYDFGMGMEFIANHVGSIGNYTPIYDAYRINSVKLTIRWLNGSSPGPGAAGSIVSPTIYAIRDNDDSIPPTSSNGLARQGRSIYRFDNKSKTAFSITVKPKMSTVVQATPVGTVRAVSKAMWVDCKNTIATHYGLKMWFENVALPDPSLYQTAFEVTYQYNVSFRGAQTQY